ncbi:DALR domain-containing protein, partial [Caldithrix abyssi]
PGWHAECSVMSTKYLGQPFDIHGGGLENVFPHHECEIAQSEAANDKPFARYWLHNNMVTVNGQKMGKSLGNFITIKDAVKKYTPLAIRYFVLSSHYRSPLDFSDQALESAQKGLGRFHQTFARLLKAKINAKGKDEAFEKKIETYRQKFVQAMNDDFNTPKALAELFEFLKEINAWLDAGQTVTEETHKKAVQVIEETAGKVLGLLPKDYAEFESKRSGDVDAVVQILIDIRSALRKEKNFALADEIRNRLQQINIELKDTPQGTVWEYK